MLRQQAGAFKPEDFAYSCSNAPPLRFADSPRVGKYGSRRLFAFYPLMLIVSPVDFLFSVGTGRLREHKGPPIRLYFRYTSSREGNGFSGFDGND
jgi:hypothetical protein